MTEHGPDVRILRLPPDAHGRLDSVLSRLLPKVSRRRLKAALRAGRVRVDGRAVRAADAARPGVEVALLDLPDAGGTRSEAGGVRPDAGNAEGATTGPIPLEVVHADAALVVVEKPSGIPAYPRDPGEGGTVAESVLAAYPDMAGVGDQPAAPGLCHRLDLETSGLLLFARTHEAFDAVRRQFQARSVEKAYRAVVTGHLEGEGVIEVSIGRRSARRMVADPPPNLRSWPARTRWRALRHGTSTTLTSLILETGVTHQARVHLAWLGHPILGDDRYGGPKATRLALHAAELGLVHPLTGEPVHWTSRHTDALSVLLD
jgi:23S rRNA pseudouridine1911/1915/1917 synthase